MKRIIITESEKEDIMKQHNELKPLETRHVLDMNIEETLESIEELMENFILPSIGWDVTYDLEYIIHSYHQIILYIPVDMMKILPHSPQFDKEYSDKWWRYCYTNYFNTDYVKNTLRRYLGINKIMVDPIFEYVNIDLVENQATRLKDDIMVMSKKSEKYRVKDIRTIFSTQEKSFEIRLIIDGSIVGSKESFKRDVNDIISSKDSYGLLFDVTEIFFDVDFWFNHY